MKTITMLVLLALTTCLNFNVQGDTTTQNGILPNESGIYCGGTPFDPYFYSKNPFHFFGLNVTSITDTVTDTKKLDYSLKRIKNRGKRTIVNIHFFASGAEFSNPLPIDKYQKRIHAIVDHVTTDNVDILCLSEKTNVRAFPQSGRVLEQLYDYCKKRWPSVLVYQWFEGVPEDIHNQADGYFTRCSTSNETDFVKTLQPYLDSGKPVINLLPARLNRGWSHKKLKAIHDQAALHTKHGVSTLWFSLDNQTYIFAPKTNTRRLNENRWAWTSSDPFMQKLWRMVQEKVRELAGTEFDPQIYTMMEQATYEFVSGWDTKFAHIEKPKPGKILIDEDFNNTATPPDWQLEGTAGKFEIKDSTLVVSGSTGYRYLMLPGEHTDFSLTVELKYFSPTTSIGICYEYSDPKNYRSVRLMPRDIYELIYIDQTFEGKWIVPSDWIPLKMKPDQWYRVELVRTGNATYVYLDGSLRCYSVDDPDIIQPGRRVGLIHYSGPIAFKSIKLTKNFGVDFK